MARCQKWSWMSAVAILLILTASGGSAADKTLNAYSIYPENWARPMFEEFEAVTRIFSILDVFGRDEAKALDYMKKLRANVQGNTKNGGGGNIPVGLGQAGGGILFILDALKTQQEGYDVVVSFPKEAIALIKGAKNPDTARKMIDWASSPAIQNLFAKYKINFPPAHPDVQIVPGLANSFLLLFAASLADFATPLILAGNRFPVLPTDAYLQITGLFDLKGGAVLSFVLLVPAFVVFVLQRFWVSRKTYVTITGKSGA